jgi:hypothetical protein
VPLQKAAFSNTGSSSIRDYGVRWSAFNSFSQARSTSINSQEYREVSVEIIRIDDLAKECSFQPDLVKIDVESAEQHVLQGMLNLIETAHPILSVEVGDEVRTENILTSRELIEYVCQLGYEPYSHNGVRFVRHSLQESYWYGNIVFFPYQNRNL